MSKYDPPSDPFGDEKTCRICDKPLEYNLLIRAWECTHSHDKEENIMQFKIDTLVKKVGGITPDEIKQCQIVFDELRRQEGFDHPNASRIAIALAEFAVKFRKDQGIQSMIGFIKWCHAEDELYAILGTIMHDVNGRNEEFMTPRTSDYLKFYKETS